MAAVHFTTIPCEPNTASRHRESHILLRYSSLYSNNVVYTWFEVFETFLCVFASILENVRVLFNPSPLERANNPGPFQVYSRSAELFKVLAYGKNWGISPSQTRKHPFASINSFIWRTLIFLNIRKTAENLNKQKNGSFHNNLKRTLVSLKKQLW